MQGKIKRSGFICIAGCTNTGKSTLLNALIGQKIAIVSGKAQTTRHRIMGILNQGDTQMVFIDTPGIHTPRTKLGDYMMKTVEESLAGVDAVVMVLDATKGLGARDETLLEKLRMQKTPVILAVNKRDAATREEMLKTLAATEKYGWVDAVVPVSAKTGVGLEKLKAILEPYAKEGPQYFPDGVVTDQPERILAAETIREKILTLLREEVPHGVGVEIEEMSRRENGIWDISAVIICERPGHKAIIIGKSGSMIKRIGELARKDIEGMLDAKVFLQLFVKTEEDWRNRPPLLRDMGYE
ncbi:MAG: GTPase Era [Bacillota bacterium]|nr:GTPase Era [Bacillota bacterium]